MALVRWGWRVLRDREQAQFSAWMEAALQHGDAELRRYVQGLKQEVGAVQNALVFAWSNGPVEGQVNRLKTIKRSM